MEMREAAEAYCRVIENASETLRAEFIEKVAATLSSEVAVAYGLPRIELPEDADDGVEGPPITHEQWKQRCGDIQGVFQYWDNYWTTFGVYDLNESTYEPEITSLEDHAVILSLADALADIWRDLRNGLNTLGRGGSLDAVTWEWRFSFLSHWGSHATDALRAVHAQRIELERRPASV